MGSSRSISKNTSPVKLMALGGLSEIGMNCLLVETAESRILIDCGVTFDDRKLGLDLIHAEFSALGKDRNGIDALFLTHGHEDHIGGAAHLLKDFDVPVFGPPYALAMLRERLREFRPPTKPELTEIGPGDRLPVGDLEIEPYRVTHSMPDCLGLILRTPQGVVIHSGDFKIEREPTDGHHFDLERLDRLRREEGVRLLLSDSTGAMTEGRTGAEKDVAARLTKIISEAPHRAVVALFASNVHRLRALTEVAKHTGRKLCLLGRSLQNHARVAESQGYLPLLAEVAIDRSTARDVPRDKLLVLATGTQGEPAAALARLANDTHFDLTLEAGDRVYHSARIIPGHENGAMSIFDALERRGIEVTWRALDPDIHVSGHAYREEQRELLELLEPELFIPEHGSLMHLKSHARLALETGVHQALTVENGQVVELTHRGLEIVDEVQTGRVHLYRGKRVPERVIEDRQLLAEMGIAVMTLQVDRRGHAVGQPDLLTRGVVHEDEQADLLDDACDYVVNALRTAKHVVDVPDEEDIELVARRALKRFFGKSGVKKPLCYAIVMGA